MPDLDQLTEMLTQTSQEDLDTVLQRVQEIKNARDWPKETTIYIHGDEDSNHDIAQELGLSEEARETFRGTAYEVALLVSVSVDGQATLKAVGGQNGFVELNEPIRI